MCASVHLCIKKYTENMRDFPEIQAGALKTSHRAWKSHGDSSCANAM